MDIYTKPTNYCSIFEDSWLQFDPVNIFTLESIKTIDLSNAEEIARDIGKAFRTSVLLKGGHLDSTNNTLTDFLFLQESKEVHRITHPKVDTNNTHGTGCSLSSSIAAFLSLGLDVEQAVKKACA